MAEKGGKSALKSTVGNNGSSSMSKKGKKVQFDSEDSLENSIPKSNGNADKSGSKGGKGDKISNGSKKPTGKAPSPAERRLEQEIPQNSICLMDCEAAEILQNIHDQMTILSQDPDIKLPTSFDMGLTYAKRGGDDVKSQTLKEILEPLKKYGLSDCEICLIANICPESVDEAFGLVPALKPKMSKLKDRLGIVLGVIAKLKEDKANIRNSASRSRE